MAVVQVELTDEETRRLIEVAAENRLTVDSLIHEAVVEKLLRAKPFRTDEMRRRAVAAAGRFHAAENDLGPNHDKYLTKAFEP
ncbi:MAG TPA: CopG family transcriptional regulator [Armatimonadota bacterium]|nr:CopG family transcriptional regulator [Armatimonadota bacterium]